MRNNDTHSQRRQERAEESIENLLAIVRMAQIGEDCGDPQALRAAALAACSAMATCALAGKRSMVRREAKLRGLATAPDLDLVVIERAAHEALEGLVVGRERRPVQPSLNRLTELRWSRCTAYLADPILLTTMGGGHLSPPAPRAADRMVLELVAAGGATGEGADLAELGVTPGRVRGRITEANAWLATYFDVRENRKPIFRRHDRYWPRIRLIMGAPGHTAVCVSCGEGFTPYQCLRCASSISDRCRDCHDDHAHGVVRLT
ncbi:MAG: hypothetical protein AB7K09_10270 [Planctomycetota bacterium]